MILRVFLQPPKKKVPCTIKNTRELNETVCKPDDDEVQVHELDFSNTRSAHCVQNL
ncbi:hypothetical protein AAZX31_09G072700 [Glycine max]